MRLSPSHAAGQSVGLEPRTGTEPVKCLRERVKGQRSDGLGPVCGPDGYGPASVSAPISRRDGPGPALVCDQLDARGTLRLCSQARGLESLRMATCLNINTCRLARPIQRAMRAAEKEPFARRRRTAPAPAALNARSRRRPAAGALSRTECALAAASILSARVTVSHRCQSICSWMHTLHQKEQFSPH